MIRINHILIIISALLISATQAQPLKSSFILQGNIDGLYKGDALFLSTYTIPRWEVEKTDTFYVEKENFFSHAQPVAHTQYYLLKYAPKEKEPLPTPLLGIDILAKPGDVIILNGTTDLLSTSLKKGGFYDNLRIRTRDSIGNKFYKEAITIHRKIQNAHKEKQPDSIKKYVEALYAINHARSRAIKQLNDSITYKTHNSEYAAFQFLMENFDWNYSNGKERYNKFASDIKTSFYGNCIAELLNKKKKLEPGKTPPDFTFTTTLGKRISLPDYKGKHLLLYWWGMCPGSIDINPKLVKMYQKYHDKGLEIIGITREDISALKLQIDPQNDEEKQKFKIFFNPLWDVVDARNKSNNEIVEAYIFNALPTVMLISPKGKNIYRGYNNYDALEKAFLANLNQK